ncbi:hypothetical protein AAF712_011437 [Marasmius tenuissimus]|uniref:CxC2-like cysteine cluster KDZ transposase-associated domain-containing protein n=1 Tax=Marasmius tenuissimus TaxID=585030 RepID=A0ABR2ZK86_9AGAR
MANQRRRSGVSGRVKHVIGRGGGPARVEYKSVRKTPEELRRDRERFYAMFIALNFTGREDLAGGDLPGIPMYDNDPAWEDNDNDFGPMPPPPGEEGAFHSHDGEGTYDRVLTGLLGHKRRYRDTRTRRDRTERQTHSWAHQHDRLVDAYLEYRLHGPPLQEKGVGTWELQQVGFDFFGVDLFFHPLHSQSINESLLRVGYLGGSPECPAIAFDLQVLEAYRHLHRVCPALSIEAYSRALSHMHNKPRHRHLEDQLRVAYDEYLVIQCSVDNRIALALSHNNDNYLVQNICTPCMYELEEEPRLNPRILMVMDGNNSLKMVDSEHKRGQARIDTRELHDPRWLSSSAVDEFKDEVANAQRAARKKPAVASDVTPALNPSSVAINTDTQSPVSGGADPDVLNAQSLSEPEEEIAWLNVLETDELRACVDACVDRWKAASPDAQKKMFAFFAITGVFVAVCRHGHLIVMCDMRRSGELMKYPLAITDAILERYGEEIGLGYDIMSAKLGAKVVALRLQGVVPAFHGHAHNRKCQLYWHPTYIPGLGIFDFEECERLFSLSNRLASTTRLATLFHRRQIILEHFNFHSQDKDANFGNWAHQMYREALSRLDNKEPVFKQKCRELRMEPQDCEKMLEQEREFFLKDFTESPETAQKLDYAELLLKLWTTKALSDEADHEYTKMTKVQGRGHTPQKRLTIQSRRNAMFTRWSAVNEQVCMFEMDHSIPERWLPDGSEYLEALEGLKCRTYRRALDKLERLVVQRLFELNMSGVGYKQRNKITAALRARAEAIRKAITSYNSAASKLNPPRETIDWAQIVEMVTLADFDLLKNTDVDIRQLAWAKPSHRFLTQLYFDIKRAREEIVRLNVEIKRKITSMLDDSADYYWAEHRAMQAGDTDLAVLLGRERHKRSVFFESIVSRLVETSNLRGFSGSLIPGQRLGRDPNLMGQAPLPAWATSVLGLYRDKQSNCTDNDSCPTDFGYNIRANTSANFVVDNTASDEEDDLDVNEGGSDEEADKTDHLLQFIEDLSIQ